MTFDEWWKECSGWYTEAYDASGLSEWCLAKDAWDYHSKRIAELEVELAELREAARDYQRTVNTWQVIGFNNTGKNAFFSASNKLTALLQEKWE